ncbi:MAG: transposase [Verrucomicrobia bacterium]|nr:MAG: transposase [Verrucomicrobiota bacterium]
MAADAPGNLRPLDATHIKVHRGAANPAGGQSEHSIGRTKGGLDTTLTALDDSHGRALQLTLAPGNRADVKAAEQIWAPVGKRVVADKGYDSDPFREALKREAATTSIPPRSNRTSPTPFHRGYYRLRHHVDNFFQRIKRWRAVGTRYDKLDLPFSCLNSTRGRLGLAHPKGLKTRPSCFGVRNRRAKARPESCGGAGGYRRLR